MHPGESKLKSKVSRWHAVLLVGCALLFLLSFAMVFADQPWSQYKWRIGLVMSFLILQTLLIAGLLLERNRKTKAARDLAESEERYRTVVETQTDLICRYLPDTTLTFVNEAYCQYFGKSKEELIGSRFINLIPEHSRDATRIHIQKIIESGETITQEHEVLRFDRTIGWHHWTNSVISKDGEIVELQGIGHDITQRKEAELALRESEERNRAILNAIPDLMFLQSENGVYLDYHAKEPSDLLVSSEQFLGRNMAEILPPDLSAEFQSIFKRVLETKTTQVHEYSLEIEGQQRWYEARITPCNGSKVLSVVREVTERKLAEEALIDSEEFNRRIVESSNECIKILDLEGNLVYMSPNGQRLLGITDIAPYINSSWIAGWGETGRKLAKEAIERARNGEIGVFQSFGTTPQGLTKWWDTVITPIRGARGRIDRLLAISRDITERRNLEENLRLSEREFSTLVENSPDIISRLDLDLRYIYISPRILQKTGIPAERFIGKTPGEIGLEGYDWKSFEASCRESIASGKTSQRVFGFQDRTYSTRVIPERTPEGSVESLMAISEDVTERIQADRELLNLTGQLLNSQDEERRRIARELHDGTAQNLFGISMNLGKLADMTPGESEAQKLIDECQSLGNESLQEIRTLSYLLHPPLLEHAGLVSALQWYVEGFNQRSGIYVDVIAQNIDRLPPEVEMALFRVVQEALTNVRRHSGSEAASIRLERRSGEIVLEISDSGKGMQYKKDVDESGEMIAAGVGISGMRQRLRQLGGRLDIATNKEGTRISAFVPLANGASHGANSAGR